MNPCGKTPSLCSPHPCLWGCHDSWGCFSRGLGNCHLSLSQTQTSPVMNGPSTCSPWMKTSSAWSCPSSFVTTSWSVGHSHWDTALQDGSLSLAHLLGLGQKSFVQRADA